MVSAESICCRTAPFPPAGTDEARAWLFHGPFSSSCAVRMLLKSGYRYVYISRKFAIKNGFIPRDAAPGHYGYSGLVK